MITGKLMFDVEIEAQKSDEDVKKLSEAITKAVNAVIGVDFVEQVDEELDNDEE